MAEPAVAPSLGPLDHEEEYLTSAIPRLEARYAKNCIPVWNECNVTVVTHC